MPFLTVGGVTVPVGPDGASIDFEEVGERARAIDGTMRSTILARKRVAKVKTSPMTTSDATTLETAINGSPPVAVTGDFLGSANFYPQLESKEAVVVAGGHRVVLAFTLHEA